MSISKEQLDRLEWELSDDEDAPDLLSVPALHTARELVRLYRPAVVVQPQEGFATTGCAVGGIGGAAVITVAGKRFTAAEWREFCKTTTLGEPSNPPLPPARAREDE